MVTTEMPLEVAWGGKSDAPPDLDCSPVSRIQLLFYLIHSIFIRIAACGHTKQDANEQGKS